MNCNPERQALLLAQGWRRRFAADQPRLGQAVAAYRQMGLEVRLEPVDPAACQAGGGCAACWAEAGPAAGLKVIFTRPGGGPPSGHDPLDS